MVWFFSRKEFNDLNVNQNKNKTIFNIEYNIVQSWRSMAAHGHENTKESYPCKFNSTTMRLSETYYWKFLQTLCFTITFYYI